MASRVRRSEFRRTAGQSGGTLPVRRVDFPANNWALKLVLMRDARAAEPEPFFPSV